MAAVTIELVGLARPEVMADELERVAKLLRDGCHLGGTLENGHWYADGIDKDADAEDESAD